MPSYLTFTTAKVKKLQSYFFPNSHGWNVIKEHSSEGFKFFFVVSHSSFIVDSTLDLNAYASKTLTHSAQDLYSF